MYIIPCYETKVLNIVPQSLIPYSFTFTCIHTV